MSRLPPLLMLAAVWAALLTPAARAQDEFRTGTHVLRRLLHERQFSALKSWASASQDPGSTVLILIGRPSDRNDQFAWQVPGGLWHFVNAGGAVLMATDYPLDTPEVQEFCGYQVLGNRVHAWKPDDVPGRPGAGADPEYIYRGQLSDLRECIILGPVRDAEPSLFWEVRGVRGRISLRVVTNRSASLEMTGVAPDGVQVLANFPPRCWYVHNMRSEVKPVPSPFAVSRQLGAGRFLLMSDHSVLVNEMLLQEDNGNLDFAYNTIEWLRDSRRTRVLIVEDGEIQTQLDISLHQEAQPLRQLQPAFADEVNKHIQALQASHQRTGHFDNLAAEGLNHVPGELLFGSYNRENFTLLLAVLGGLAVALFGFARLVRGSHGHEIAPVFASFGGRHRPAASPLALRQRSALGGNDLREFAREAARDWFASIPGCPPSAAGAKPPRIDARGGWWSRWRMRRAVRELWRLASTAHVSRVTKADFRALLDRLEWLGKAFDAGNLRINW